MKKPRTYTKRKVDTKRNELIDQIKSVLVETGINPHKWTKLAKELNNRSIFTKGGKPWTMMNLKNFCEKNLPFEECTAPDIQQTDTRTFESSAFVEQAKPSDVSEDTTVIQKSDEWSPMGIADDIQKYDNEMSDIHESNVLQMVKPTEDVTQLSDYFTDEEVKVLKQLVQERLRYKHLPMRIEFKRDDTCNKSVRLSVELFQDVVKREPNFSKLVEVLLWEYMGRDPKYLKKTDQ